MKVTTSVAALLVSIAFPVGMASAQNDGGAAAGAGVGAVVSPDAANQGAGANAGMPGQMTRFSDVITAMGDSSMATTDLQGLTTVNSINVIKLSSLEGNNQQMLDDAMTSNESKMTSLHAAIDANASLKTKLDAEGIQTEDIVAIQVDDTTGTVHVYTKG